MRANARSIWASFSRSLLRTISSWSRSKLVAPISAWSCPAPSPASRISPASSSCCAVRVRTTRARSSLRSEMTSSSSAFVHGFSPGRIGRSAGFTPPLRVLAGAFLAGAFFPGAAVLTAAFFAGAAFVAACLAAGAFLARTFRACALLADVFFAGVFFAGVFFAGAFFAGAFLPGVFWADVFWADVFWADVFWADVFWADVFWADVFLPDAFWAGAAPLADALVNGAGFLPTAFFGVGAFFETVLLSDAAFLADAALLAGPVVAPDDPAVRRDTALRVAEAALPASD